MEKPVSWRIFRFLSGQRRLKRILERRLVVLSLGIVLMLTGCQVLNDGSQTTVQSSEQILKAGMKAGQTLTARYAGLESVSIYLKPVKPGSGRVRLHLQATPGSTEDISESGLALAEVNEAGFYSLQFTPQPDSNNQDYFVQLELEGQGEIALGTAPAAVYLQGSAYWNGVPVDFQLAFRLNYRPQSLLKGLLLESWGMLGTIGKVILLFILPGLALLSLLWPEGNRLSWSSRLALAGGVSLAIYPVFMLWTNLVGLRLGAGYAWLPLLMAGGYFILIGGKLGVRRIITAVRSLWRPPALPDWMMILALSLAAGIRILVVRGVDLPMWGDSYQHTVITDLMVKAGGLFQSWQPFADLQGLNYHFGFHALAAAYSWLSGQESAQAVLVVGQAVNFLAVLAVVPLAQKISGQNRWAGTAAVIAAGLLAPLPMGYANWGRYTQLAGQVILPIAVWLSWEMMEGNPASKRGLVLGSLLWGGLALTHYRVLILGSLFFVPFLVSLAIQKRWRAALPGMAALAAGGLVLFLPWLINIYGGKILLNFSAKLATPAAALSAFTREYNMIAPLDFYLPVGLWVAAAAGLAGAILRKDRNSVVLVTWWLMILLAANPSWLGLPGDGILTNFAVLIAVYIPASILVGVGAGWLADRFYPLHRIPGILLATTLVGAALWGAGQRLNDLQVTANSLAVRPDERAAAWIMANTPLTARFMVNNFFAYGGSALVGSDGGWWLPYLTGRETNLPPLTYTSEQSPHPAYVDWINALSTEVFEKGIDSPDVLGMLKERGFTHLYIGQQQGAVNNAGPAFLDLGKITASSHFRPVYHQDRVWIFEILY